MAIWQADQLVGSKGLGTAAAGLGGSNVKRRSSEVAKRSKYFSFTIPAGFAAGDTIEIAEMGPFDRFVALHVAWSAGVGGVGATLSAGKLDTNNSANTDAAHYKAATAATAAGSFDADTNINEQIGTDPSGAVTDAGNAIQPGATGGGFGSGPIYATLTEAVGAPTVGTLISGRLTIEPGGD